MRGEMSRLRRPSSPAPAPGAPLEDDDLLSEILLRLPPLPSSLPRASLVCKRWRRLVTDRAGFLRRFRARHRRDAPLLGFFTESNHELRFTPALEPPDRVPPERFCLQLQIDELFHHDCCVVTGCRHGLVVILNLERGQVLVWDPVTGDQRRVAFPPGLDDANSAAVVRAATGDGCPPQFQFQVVLVRAGPLIQGADACVYSSETSLWGNLATTPLPGVQALCGPDTLDGNSVYWSLMRGSGDAILEFDLDKQCLAVTPFPLGMSTRTGQVMSAKGGGLGLLTVSGTARGLHLWKKKTDSGGFASWVLTRTIDLGRLLSLSSDERIGMLQFTEENNTVFLRTDTCMFMVHVDSTQFRKLPLNTLPQSFYPFPFASIYTADLGIGDGYAGAELLPST